MINPMKLFEYEPLDRSKLSWPAKILVWFIEYFARIMGAIYLSISLLIVSILPMKRASKTFFHLIGMAADMYRAKHMKEDYEDGTNDTKTMEKGNDKKVSSMENKK